MTMSETVAELKCPRCGVALDASVANAICPACLLKQAALGTGTDSFPAMPWTPPNWHQRFRSLKCWNSSGMAEWGRSTRLGRSRWGGWWR